VADAAGGAGVGVGRGDELVGAAVGQQRREAGAQRVVGAGFEWFGRREGGELVFGFVGAFGVFGKDPEAVGGFGFEPFDRRRDADRRVARRDRPFAGQLGAGEAPSVFFLLPHGQVFDRLVGGEAEAFDPGP
jgi:hypothetical protein